MPSFSVSGFVTEMEWELHVQREQKSCGVATLLLLSLLQRENFVKM